MLQEAVEIDRETENFSISDDEREDAGFVKEFKAQENEGALMPMSIDQSADFRRPSALPEWAQEALKFIVPAVVLVVFLFAVLSRMGRVAPYVAPVYDNSTVSSL
eukprot:CAMPEP_0184007780 /NCGR_PEP_ID=MMETSP0954-20121128/1554_1 /TAXON_ID=627963 /ORGANISM="Aplanochytrium sp, Strain PBS07" /LENGTH=104 /DNA_ID=CAMNT_0026286709 /DNA_START=730 /DNA_END=1040 /DNA_ORIENTATION=-